MKKTFIALTAIYFAFTACGSNETKNGDSQTGIDSTEMAPLPSSSEPGEVAKPAPSTTTEPVVTNETEAKETAAKGTAAPTAEKAALDPAQVKKGEALIAKSDCLACHKLKDKVVGPAYSDVAAKYPATAKNIEYLAGKIKKGGAGVWGEIPMTPHPTLSNDDAKAMAQYVLSIK